ncbi:hypothetical protein AZ54_07895 [Xanthomonas oryzae pv. oryzae PXO86]|nr:hypothetical protein AZ54_07895 [Xanthomonas oryzae pv. oryzae PXO86]
MTAKVFEAALGIGAPWSVGAVEFDEATKVLTVPVDFKPGTRFKVSGAASTLDRNTNGCEVIQAT